MPVLSAVRRSRVAIASCAAAMAITVASASSALAAPGHIGHGTITVYQSGKKGYYAYAFFETGTGHIRASLKCRSGDQEFWVYGPWVAKEDTSRTITCTYIVGDGSFETKNS